MDRGDLARRQRYRADPAHPVDLHVVTLCLQVIDGGTGRLGARYRPHRLGGRDGRTGKEFAAVTKSRSERPVPSDIAVLLTRGASRIQPLRQFCDAGAPL